MKTICLAFFIFETSLPSENLAQATRAPKERTLADKYFKLPSAVSSIMKDLTIFTVQTPTQKWSGSASVYSFILSNF